MWPKYTFNSHNVNYVCLRFVFLQTFFKHFTQTYIRIVEKVLSFYALLSATEYSTLNAKSIVNMFEIILARNGTHWKSIWGAKRYVTLLLLFHENVEAILWGIYIFHIFVAAYTNIYVRIDSTILMAPGGTINDGRQP